MTMHISDAHLDEVHTKGFTVMEGFVEPDLLAAAQQNLWDIFPTPETYFSDPETHRRFVRGQFSGIRHYPFPADALNRLAIHPDLIDAAARYCDTTDLDIYKIELWGKYSGAVDYDQGHHRDYAGHTLTVTKDASDFRMMTTFILLSDVTMETGPTKVVPLEYSRHLARHIGEIEPERDTDGPFGRGTFDDVEVSVTGKAGSIFIYHPDVVHRGSSLLGREVSRFALLVDLSPIRKRWTGKQSWPTHATSPLWKAPFIAMSPYERTLFGFPGIDDDFWDEQTIRDTGNRYAGMNMEPYTDALRRREALGLR
jgi:Phytanoyl-CoA dioxygenase (PhyH)